MQPSSKRNTGGALALERQLIADLTEKIRGSGSSREVLVKRVADALREQIGSGKLKPGARLISEVALAQKLEMSRRAPRGDPHSRPRGSPQHQARGRPLHADEHRLIWGRLDAMRSFTDLIRSVGGVPGDSHVKVALVPAPNDAAEALDIAPQDPVGLVTRVRLIDGTPLAIANEYVLLARPEEASARLKSFRGGSLYAFLRDRCGVTLSRSSVVIAAIPADAERAKLLKVRKGTPLLLLQEPHYDMAGKPVLFAVNYHNSDLVQFTLTRAGLRT